MRILAIDPGTLVSGAVLYDSKRRRVVWSANKIENADLTGIIKANFVVVDAEWERWDVVAIERMQAMQHVNGEIMQTVEWYGRFYEAADYQGFDTRGHYRREVCRHLHVSGANKDGQVRARCIELHGGTKRAAQGLKKSPGPLFGVAGHAWQALGLALLVADI